MRPATETQHRIGISELERRLAIERSTIWRWYSAGRFPVPHYIGTRRCWWVHEIEKWEAEQLTRQTPQQVGQTMTNATITT